MSCSVITLFSIRVCQLFLVPVWTYHYSTATVELRPSVDGFSTPAKTCGVCIHMLCLSHCFDVMCTVLFISGPGFNLPRGFLTQVVRVRAKLKFKVIRRFWRPTPGTRPH